MKTILFCLLFPVCILAGRPLQQLLDSNLVEVKVLGSADLKATITLINLTDLAIDVVIEHGRRLICADTSRQNLLLCRDREVLVQPGSAETVVVQGYCCNAHRIGPKDGEQYYINALDKPEWLSFTALTNVRDFPKQAIQQAVWTLSDNLPLSAVFCPDPHDTQILRQTLANIKHIAIPWYFTEMVPPEPAGPMATDVPAYLHGQFEYAVNGNSIVSIVIKNEMNEVVKVLVKGNPNSSGSHTYDLHLDVHGWKRGKYRLQAISDFSNIIASLPFEL